MKSKALKMSLYIFGLLASLTSLEGARSTQWSRALTIKEISEQETKLIAIVNQERKRHGLSALVPWKTLSYHAREHSQNMADGAVDFGHSGFEARANAIQKTASCHSVGENVAYCYLFDDPLVKSLDMWMKSPHHCENILGDYKETGIGIAYDDEGRCYITQLFSRRRS